MLQVVKHMLTFGADVMVNKAGKTLVQLAEEGAMKDILKELQKKEKGGYALTDEKRAQNMEKFKAQGNKVWIDTYMCSIPGLCNRCKIDHVNAL